MWQVPCKDEMVHSTSTVLLLRLFLAFLAGFAPNFCIFYSPSPNQRLSGKWLCFCCILAKFGVPNVTTFM